jgi:hypothetical protein
MISRLLASALAGLALSTAPFAQCAEWDTGFGSGIAGANDAVMATAVFDDGSGPALYAAGNFTSAGGAIADRIARWNGTSWSPLGPSGSGANLSIRALAAFDDGSGSALYAGGNFTSIGGVAANFIAKWNGTSWSPLFPPGDGTNAPVTCLSVFDDGTGPALFVGGNFTTAGPLAVGRVAKWDGSSWSALGPPATDGALLALRAFDDGSGEALYAAGNFTTLCGTQAGRIARWNGADWSAVGGGLSSGANTCSVEVERSRVVRARLRDQRQRSRSRELRRRIGTEALRRGNVHRGR